MPCTIQDIACLAEKIPGLLRRIEAIEDSDQLFNVVTFGAKGDGVTDDTAAIQRATDAAGVSGGTVFFPNGRYLIAGAFRPSHSHNIQHYGQIIFPAATEAGPLVTIRWLGETPPNLHTNGVSDNIPNPDDGVVLIGGIFSPVPGYQYGIVSSYAPAAPVGYDFGPWNFNQIMLENIHIRAKSINGVTHVDAGLTALDLSRCAMASVRYTRVDTESTQAQSANPVAGNSNGIRMPDSTNFLVNEMHYVLVQNFFTGVNVSEHVDMSEVFVSTCYYGIFYVGGHHPARFTKVKVNWCRTPFRFSGACTIQNGQAEVEMYGGPYPSRWYDASTIFVGIGGSTLRGFLTISAGLAGGTYTTLSSSSLDTTLCQIVDIRNPFFNGIDTKATTGDAAAPTFNQARLVINTFDNTFKVYAEGAWRTITTW